MGLPVLASFIELYQMHRRRHKDNVGLLSDLLGIISGCIQHEVESLAKIGVQSFNDLVYALTSGEGEESASSHDDDDSGVGTEDFFNEKGFSGNLSGRIRTASAQVGDTSDVTSIQSLGEHTCLPQRL